MYSNRQGIRFAPISGRSQRRRAFSFIEVMIVVVIIGLLAGTVTLASKHYLDRAKRSRAKADIATYQSALVSYYADTGRYPTTAGPGGARAQVRRPRACRPVGTRLRICLPRPQPSAMCPFSGNVFIFSMHGDPFR